ncbi:MAG: hypothetical protein KME33_38965 [Aetokthonos hydrillicola CCALA 1050]|nr:hypothetical protein [Aetokthonos hydrillicola CCALA 1050]
MGSSQVHEQVTFPSPNSPGNLIISTICGTPVAQAQSDQARITQAQLEALTRAQATSSQGINNAMSAAANLFK